MKFEYNGQKFELEFVRKFGVVGNRTYEIEVEEDGPDGTLTIKQSRPLPTRNPYTTVNLYVYMEDKPVLYRTATVGGFHKDKFTYEKGRRVALEALLKGSFDAGQVSELGVPTKLNQDSKKFRKALWDAYFARPMVLKEKVVKETPYQRGMGN